MASVRVADVQAADGVFSADDGTTRSLSIVANSKPDSSVVLGAWDAAGKTIVSFLSTSANGGVRVSAPMTSASTITATGFTDGLATLAGGALMGAKAVTCDTLTAGAVSDGTLSISAGQITKAKLVSADAITDGVATLGAGALKAKTVTADSVSDGVATLSGGRLEGLKSLSLSGPFTIGSIAASAVTLPNDGCVYFGAMNTTNSWRLMVDTTENRFKIQMYDAVTRKYVARAQFS